MKQAILLVICVLSVACGSATLASLAHKPSETFKQETFSLGEELKITEIQRDVFVVEHSFPWPANSLISRIGENLFLLIDTPYTPQATQLVVEWLETRYGRVELNVINTGYHIDNLGGNEYLIQKGYTVYGSELTSRLLKSNAEQTQAQILQWLKKPSDKPYHDVYDQMTFVPPTTLFDVKEIVTLQLGDDSVEIFYPGPSHAQDNVAVYLKKQNILFGGCMVKSQQSTNLGFTGDADLEAWPKSLELLKKRYNHAPIVVPGHGDSGNSSLMEHTLSLLNK